MQPTYIPIIATELGIHPNQVEATIRLIDEGATTPFIARYRKELTHSLDEVHIENIRNLHTRYAELIKRKQSILDTIQEQGKLTPDLEQSILTTWDSHLLEDLYLPYKPKRKTKASIAREKGLETLALWMIQEYVSDPLVEAKKYLSKEVSTIEDALQGARDIIADIINEHSGARSMIRQLYDKHAILYARVAKGQEAAGDQYKIILSMKKSYNDAHLTGYSQYSEVKRKVSSNYPLNQMRIPAFKN